MTWRVGLLIPSSNSVMEVDFYRRLPHDATLHTGRMFAPDSTVAGEERMLDQYTMPAAEALRTAVPHVVVLGTMSSGVLRGKDYDRELCERIARTTCAVPVSAVAAVNQALRETRASRIAVVTPHTDTVNQRIKASIEAEGIEVSAIHGMGISTFDTASITPEGIYAFVQSKIGPRVAGDALYLACTNYHAMGAVSLLKVTYEVPIVTTNLAALQAVKRTLDDLRDRAMPQTAPVLPRTMGQRR